MKTINLFFNGGFNWKIVIDERESTITLKKLETDYDEKTKKEIAVEARPTWNQKKFIDLFFGRDQNKVNFLVVRWSAYKYSCVYGEQIIKFELKNKDTIESVVSKFGNAYVPYPLMIGKEFTYLIDDKKILKIHNDDYQKRKDLNNLYANMWGLQWLQERARGKKMNAKERAKFEIDLEKAREWRQKFTNL